MPREIAFHAREEREHVRGRARDRLLVLRFEPAARVGVRESVGKQGEHVAQAPHRAGPRAERGAQRLERRVAPRASGAAMFRGAVRFQRRARTTSNQPPSKLVISRATN